MKLYEITNEIKSLENLLEIEELDEKTYNDTLEILSLELKEKSGNIIKFINNFISENEVLDLEIKRLSELKKIRENKLNNLKKYITICMQNLNLKKIETAFGNLSFRKSESLEIINSDEIPSEYKTIEINEKIDKVLIKKDIKSGKIINGVSLKINMNLQIK